MLAISFAALAYDYPAHYLVGLANYPNADVPAIFQNVTSGTAKARPEGGLTCEEAGFANPWCDTEFGPWSYVPSVGFSDIEFYYDEAGQKVTGEFLCLTDNGYGGSANSWDYPCVVLALSTGHGESRFERCAHARPQPRGLTPSSRAHPLPPSPTGCTSTTRRSASPSLSATVAPPSRRTRRPSPRTSSYCTTRTSTSSGRTAPTSR